MSYAGPHEGFSSAHVTWHTFGTMTSLFSQDFRYIGKMYIVLTHATEYSCYYS